MAITVATFEVTNTDLKFPDRKRRDFHIEDDQGNVRDYRGIDAPPDFDDQAFLDNELVPSFERSVREQAIREDEEAKAAASLATLEQAVENEKEGIEDAIKIRLKAQVI